MKKILFLFLFFFGLNQAFADITFNNVQPTESNCGAIFGSPTNFRTGHNSFDFNQDGTTLYFETDDNGTFTRTYYIKSVILNTPYDCTTGGAVTTLASQTTNAFTDIYFYENFLYFKTNNLIKKISVADNTQTTLLTAPNITHYIYIDKITGTLFWKKFSGTGSNWDLSSYSLTGGGFESIASIDNFTYSGIELIDSNSNTFIFYNNYLYFLYSTGVSQLGIYKFQLINVLGTYSINYINTQTINGTFGAIYSEYFRGIKNINESQGIAVNFSSQTLAKKIIFSLENTYTPPTEFSLAYIQAQAPQQLYSGFKTYIQSIYDIDTGNDITNNVFYYIEYLSGTGSGYPLTTSNFNVGLNPQVVTYPYHTLVGDYKATAKFVFNEVEYTLFEFNYNVIQAATPGDAQTDNCNFFDYDCDGEVGILNGEFLKSLGRWIYTPVDYIVTYIGKVKEFIGSLQDIFTTEERSIGFFDIIPKANANEFNPLNNLPSQENKNVMTDLMIFGKGFVVLIFLVLSIVFFIALNRKKHE